MLGFSHIHESPLVPGAMVITIVRIKGGNTKTAKRDDEGANPIAPAPDICETWHFAYVVQDDGTVMPFHHTRHDGAHDESACGRCKHRPKKGQKQNTCYVTGREMRAIYESWLNGNYVPWQEFAPSFEQALAWAGEGRTVRLGAYGDPVVMGHDAIVSLLSSAVDWMGYSHQWELEEFQWAKDYVMASADTPDEMAKAVLELGWRPYTPHSPDMSTQEALTKVRSLGLKVLQCPTAKVSCSQCPIKCNGAGSAATTKHAVITKAHGAPNIVKQYRNSEANTAWLEA